MHTRYGKNGIFIAVGSMATVNRIIHITHNRAIFGFFSFDVSAAEKKTAKHTSGITLIITPIIFCVKCKVAVSFTASFAQSNIL